MAHTTDGFLGGRLTIRQPATGYRAGVDPVLLAAATAAVPGARVLELGCGVGVAILCLSARVPDLTLAGVELQADYAELARENAAANGQALSVYTADLTALPAALRAQSFDHVIANPPYFQPGAATASTDPGRAAAHGEATPLAEWIDAGLRRLVPGGQFTLIQRAERLPEILMAFAGRAGGIHVRPVAGRAGRAADRVLVQAQKGARAPFRLLPPLVMHAGATHDGDRESYTAEVQAVLRDAAAIPWTAG